MNNFDMIIAMSTPKYCTECFGRRLRKTDLHTYVCESCNHEMYDDFGKIRNYLDQFPGANAMEISLGTGVSKDVIKECLKEGYLEVVPGARTISICTQCGRSTTNIGLCDFCREKLSNMNTKASGISSTKIYSSGRFRTR